MRSGSLLLFAVLLLGIASPAMPQNSRNKAPLEVTYIANEGFLIAVGSSKVMIDALHNNPWGYQSTPDEALEAMIAGQPPFDGVDLLIASHDHADHFNARWVHRYLLHQPDVVFVSSERAVNALEDSAGAEYGRIQSQVLNVNPQWGGCDELAVDGIRARFLTLNHADESNERFLTLGSLVTILGRKILHLADMAPQTTTAFLEGYGLAGEGIDVAFVDNFFALDETGRRLLRDHIRPKHIVLMHIRPDEVEQIREQARQIFPDAVVFDAPLQRRTFDR